MATAIHQYEDKLLDFAYGELPAPEASAVESHVKSCPRCSQALEQIRGVRTHMAALPTLAAPDAGLESLLAYAEQAASRNAAAAKVTSPPWWRRMIAPAAGVLALSLVVVVAVQTNKEGLDLSREAAFKELKKSEEKVAEKAAPAPEPVVAAAPPQLDEAKKEDVWSPEANKQQLAKNNEGYEQQMGATRSREDNRQMAQQKDLGDVLKQSKTRRDQDFGNARGGYVAEREAEKKSKKPAPAANDKLAAATASPNENDNYGLSSAPQVKAEAKAPPAPPQAQPAAAPPPKQVAAKEAPAPAPEKAKAGADRESRAEEESMKGEKTVAEKPAEAKPSKPSLSFGLGTAGPSGSSGGGYTGNGSGSSYGGATKAPSAVGPRKSADTSDDDLAGRGASSIADSKRMKDDVQSDQAALEHDARPHLDAARAAANQNNYQEEVNQLMYVLKTGVKGAYRAEALSRLCSTLAELGNEGQADKYCDALLTEFPNSAAARVVAQRRSNVQNAPKPTAKKAAPPTNYDEAAEPAKAKKAVDQAAPSTTSY